MGSEAGSGPAAAALLERERELEELERAVAGAGAGAGALLLVEGPAGIGKTRLLEATAAIARESGIGVLSARASRLEREFSFGVVLQLLADRVAGTDDDRVLSGTASLARPLFLAGERPPGLTTGDSLFSLIHGLHRLLVNLAEREPLLLCVDDAHWADWPSLALLSYLRPRVEELPVAIVVAVRTGEPAQDEAEELIAELRARRSSVLTPASLSPPASTSRVREAFPGAAEEFCDACAVASGGNPFYLAELIAAAITDGIEPTARDAARVSELSPDSVSRAVLTRLGRLPGIARELAEAVAVLGDDAPLRYAADVAGRELADCVSTADRLIEAEVFAPREPLSFAHPIVGNAVYADIAPARRNQAHRHAAELLHRDEAATERVASHLLNASPADAEWVRRVLRRAAERAHARGAPRATVRYVRRALEEAPAAAERGELLALCGLAEAEAGEPTATETLAEAVPLIETPQQRARALFDLAFVLSHGGRYPHAAEAAERGRRELGRADPALAGELDALYAMSRTYVDLTDPAATARHVEASIASHEIDASAAGRAVLGNASIALGFAGASATTLRALAERTTHRGRPSDDPFDVSAFTLASFGYLVAGDLDGAERASAAALEAASRRGSILELGAAMHVRSMARLAAGRVREAVADAESAVEAGRWGWGATLPMAHSALALALLERGQIDSAEAALELPGGEQRWAVNVSYGMYLVARAAVWRAQGRGAEALDQLLLAGRLAEAVNARHSALCPWRPAAVELLLASAEREDARRLAEEDVERARAFGAPGPLGAALRAEGLARGGGQGLELLRESERLLAPTGARLEHARSLVSLGAALARAGKRHEARRALRRGLDSAHRCASAALIDQAAEELRVAGARPRRAALKGIAALTPGELRVAKLASEGLSNREVAERLFVTRRTVEKHLTAAYGKLEIGSREELASKLGE